jgi:hypothetical protein
MLVTAEWGHIWTRRAGGWRDGSGPAAVTTFPKAICGTDFGAFIRKQSGEYGRVIRKPYIKAE